jgi:hypothetical protein
LLRELLSRIGELKGSETDRFLKFLAILNTLIEERHLGRIIIVGGFAAEIYSGRSYRTGDVDIIIEGEAENLVRQVLKKISDFGLRIYLPKIREISEKGIDIVNNVYNKHKPPLKLQVDSYHVYIIPVCPYTSISLILLSIMIECRDLALNHLLAVDGSWDSFEPNGTRLTFP